MAEKGEPVLVFDNSSKERLFKALGYSKDNAENILDNKGKILTNQEFEPIKNNEFGGVLKGSKIAIKKDSSEIVRYFLGKKEE